MCQTKTTFTMALPLPGIRRIGNAKSGASSIQTFNKFDKTFA